MKRFFYTLPVMVLCLEIVCAGTVGLWRFDEADASSGAEISTAGNTQSPGTLDALPVSGSPVYSEDIPAAQIFDPVAGATYANGFSFDASGANAQLLTDDSADFDSSFTVEFFIKVIGEPSSYHTFLRRSEFDDLKWQVDFDHAAHAGFGRIRTRWDTPAGAPDGVAENGVDENFNFTVGPQGNANAAKVYVDTGAKDESGADVGPQNTGNPQDYVYDAASANPNETDVALQGDGINDDDSWHHVAVTFDETTGEVKIYFDYLLAQARTLEDTEGDGYTHPAAGLRFGKLVDFEYGLLIDELRYSDAILSPGSFLREAAVGGESDTVAHWRIDQEGAVEGGEIASVENIASALHTATTRNGTPIFSTDVPGAMIVDPVSGTTYENAFSMDASGGNARVGADDDPAFDTSFTVEMFMKLVGEPTGYQVFLRRREENDQRWQIDFDHAAKGAYGRLRCRFDTPAEENVNFTVGPTGGGSLPESQRMWIDTDAGDGLVASYDDPADWSLDGDGVNDIPEWHHIAVTFNQDTGEVGFYFDHELMQVRTLSDSEADGYTHPVGTLEFGKFAGAEYGMLIDEVRYSKAVLLPFQFLQVASPSEAPLEIVDVDYDSGANEVTLQWRSQSGATYAVDRSFDLPGDWFELTADEMSGGETSSYTDDTLPADTPRAYYRVRVVE